MEKHILEALLKKNAGEAVEKIARTIPGPLMAPIEKAGRTY